ncbi:hypothetical protein [Akkermansia sp.]|uniref:hypothetical protein n=1 Tax=unclassified Akkermansia TaxID=2608915 RepID=UPI003A8C0CE0
MTLLADLPGKTALTLTKVRLSAVKGWYVTAAPDSDRDRAMYWTALAWFFS